MMTTLRECYWPKGQGLVEDPAVMDARIRRLTALFLKYNLLGYLKELMLSRVLKEDFVMYRYAVKELGIASDILSYRHHDLRRDRDAPRARRHTCCQDHGDTECGDV